MVKPENDLSPWSQALALRERLEILRALGAAGIFPSGWEEAVERWQRECFLDDRIFARRLAAAGVTARELGLALLPSFGAIEENPAAAGGAGTAERIARYRLSGLAWDELSAIEGAGLARPPRAPFFGFLSRFLQYGRDLLRQRLGEPAGEGGSLDPGLIPEVEKQLLLHLAERLLKISQRTLVLAMNVARLRGGLRGSTPEERFEDFSYRHFRDPRRFLGLLREYPVLARLLVSSVDHWASGSSDLLLRLARDRAWIERDLLAGGRLGRLVQCRAAGSDPHRGGRVVFFLGFESGLELVYKPRSLAVDRQLQIVLEWLNGLSLPHRHRTIQVLDGGEYGWSERIQAAPCHTEEEVRRFYWRQGSLLAVSHLLQGSDFHQENLIAAGEHPVLVDLEALFLQQPERPAGERASAVAQGILARSVAGVGLLPALAFVDPGKAGIDISGLGGGVERELPFEVLKVTRERSDEMRFERGAARVPAAENRPTLDGQVVDLGLYVEAIEEGYAQTYSAICRHGRETRSQLASFAETEVRQLLRNTQRYAKVLQESCHPDYLRSGLARDRLLERLWAEAVLRPELEAAVPFEIDDMWLGDIPYFSARPGRCDLWSSHGTVIRDYFSRTALSQAEEQLAAMGPEDLDRQRSFIRQSIVSSRPAARGETIDPDSPRASEGDFLDAAVILGERLKNLAIHGRTDVTWIGVVPAPSGESEWVLTPLRSDLYAGTGGIALFLGCLGSITGRGDFLDLSRRCLDALLAEAAKLSPTRRTPTGAYQGLASHLYALHHLATTLERPDLLEHAPRLLEIIETQTPWDEQLDLIGGSAGCAAVLLGLFRATGDERYLEAALRCGERLQTTAVRTSSGAGWIEPASGQRLTGFSHGAAGFAWSLAELGCAGGRQDLLSLAREALAFERGHFLADEGNWADLRSSGESPAFGYFAWCNGAPGIVLGRLLLLDLLEDETMRREIEIGVETTLRIGFGFSHSLCHGDLGNAEIVWRAGERMGRADWSERSLVQASAVCRAVQARRWRCGVGTNYVETPGLMTGLAGIGYNLLRFAQPHRIPSVLSLEGPHPG
jgi:type 2 lantibiotic biosynthesis protein LanM